MQLAFWNGVRILWKLAARSHSTMCSWRRLYLRASISSCACDNEVGSRQNETLCTSPSTLVTWEDPISAQKGGHLCRVVCSTKLLKPVCC